MKTFGQILCTLSTYAQSEAMMKVKNEELLADEIT